MKLVSFTINSRTVHKIQHGGGRRYRKFPSKFWDLKVWHGVLFYSKLVPVHVYWYCLCYIKIWFYCTIPYWEYLEKNNVPLLKSYERFTAGSPRWRRCWWRHLPMSDNIFSSRGKNMQLCNEQIRTQPLFTPPCASATYSSARMCRGKNNGLSVVSTGASHPSS